MLSAFHGLIGWIPLGLPAYLFVIMVVVFFHELGHFSVARAFGVRVETFSIGFGPAIVSWMDSKGTCWKISWIPFGGYVKFFGDADVASVPDRELMKSASAEERAVALPFKPLYQRALIVAAGPFANFVLAIVILSAMLMAYGRIVQLPVVSSIQAGSAAAAGGMRAGDVIKSIDGQVIESFDAIRNVVWIRPGQKLDIVVERQGHTQSLAITPKLNTIKDELGETHTVGTLGISSRLTPQTLKHVRYGPIGAVSAAFEEVGSIVGTTLTYLWRMVTGAVATNELHGPLGIAKISGEVATLGFISLINLAALISVSIGLVNIFPVPILDGGHLLYYGCEAVLGRPLGARAQDVGFRLGLAVMLGLMVLATWNDLVRLNLF
jgi:regulator of sigma E protease